MSGFLEALPITLELEGAYTVDQGGPTYQGVTQSTYDYYRAADNLPRRDVREMEPAERDHIYHAGYWVAAHCDALPWPASLVHFDHAVNSGPARAIKTLQFAVGALPDGEWGPQTQARCELACQDPRFLAARLLFARLDYLHALVRVNPARHKASLSGWLGRVVRLSRKVVS